MFVSPKSRRDFDVAIAAERTRREAEAARTARLDALLDSGVPLAEAVRIVNH